MKSIIVGGGKIGYNLLKTLKERSHKVTLIERDKDTCLRIAEDIDGANVIWGDGTDLDILREAGIEDADIVAAVTGTDEENLVICQIAKKTFNIKKTIARVNNPKNKTMFKTLGIDDTVCSTAVIANLIEYELDNEDYRVIQTFERGNMVLVEIFIRENMPWCNKTVRNLELPKECVLASIIRADNVIYPRGDTMLVNGDKVLTITNTTVLPDLTAELFNGGDKKWGLKKKN